MKQIVRVIPKLYIEELEKPITKFGKLIAYTLLKPLLDKYSKEYHLDLNVNQERMKAQWILTIPIVTLSHQLCTAKQFVKNDGEEILESVLCRTECTSLFATDLLVQLCYK